MLYNNKYGKKMTQYYNHIETTQEVINLGYKKCTTPWNKTFILGILGGMFVSLGYMGALMITSGNDGMLAPGVIKLLGALVFPVGLMLVLLIGGDLFTGNSLITLAYLNKKVSLKQISINWLAVWVGNLVGTIGTAYLLYLSGSVNEHIAKLVLSSTLYKTHLTDIQILTSAFFCNVVVALSVWATLSAKDIVGKIFAIYFPIVLFVVSGYQHCVANMFLFGLGYLLEVDVSLGVLSNAIIMATIGNALSGGIILPAVYYYLNIYKK
jgi:formate/nitrite transporter